MDHLLKCLKRWYVLKPLLCAIVLMAATFIPVPLTAQDCNRQITGLVTDSDHRPMPGAVVQLTGQDTLVSMTDTAGIFVFSSLCKGEYIVSCTEAGHNSYREKVSLFKDNVALTILPGTTVSQLSEVIVSGQKQQEIATIAHSDLAGNELLQVRGKSLGESLKGLAGVNAVQSGPTLAKPMIHGLSGNRVLLMNNGVRQEGQQWGDDHAPEIDPFTANVITVIKGAASIRYGSDAIAGVVLLEPAKLPDEKGISGDLHLVAASNGGMGTVSGQMQGAFDKALKGLSWRLQGTVQRAGNFKTPGYYLTNTGLAEGDYAAQVGYKWKRLSLNASYNSYNAKLGIFAGAEVGDSSDVTRAYELRSKPLVADIFTYKIDRSYQTVNHAILKLGVKYEFASKNTLELTYARQADVRKEYSVDLGYSKDSTVLMQPDISFKLVTQSLDLNYKLHYAHGFSGNIGLTGSTQGNVVVGKRYLIPNFRTYSAGIFAIERYEYKKWLFEAGIRYDYRWQRVYELDNNTLGTYYVTNTYKNLTGTAGATYTANEHFSVSGNFGIGWRPPSINELYIHGVHFSAARYETGDSSLKSERSYNSTLSFNYHSDRLRVLLDIYDNEINNFIYANPNGEITTIGGKYRSYQYVQDNVRLLGADIAAQWDVLTSLMLSSKISLLRATNLTRGEGLINMPPARFQNAITYHLPDLGKLKGLYFSLENVQVLKQNYVSPGSDYVPTEAGYNLWNTSMGLQLPIGTKKLLDLNFAVDNLTNKVYSDYMNQFRFYAYNLGTNFILRAKISF